jgi:hypothetical protein
MRAAKLRQKWAWGRTNWLVVELPSPHETAADSDGIGSYLNGKHGNDNGSDKYRGIEWRILKQIPRGYIQRRINSLKERVLFAQKEIKRLSKVRTVEENKTCYTCAKHGNCHYDNLKCKKSRTHSEWKPMY